eukprot:gnl/MRDRNA2_/MRDRNA2_19021_c0_seq1.p1 gnl/MRDRNA2_/MRDRNA2_19021_c0~~gnl/MRDRNA2_/MRDRNA2_19021_c0_seq1.p1  ORF type:complete len:910 (-),score=151.54 gnl/MRDRNA2_/MRDRNA2_19021_c0_seq1:51-2780(-)
MEDSEQRVTGISISKQKAEDVLEIYEELGEGCFASVYRGFHQTIGREVAVKMLKTEVKSEAFEREIIVMSALNHPCICKCFGGYLFADGRMAFAMEYILGSDLRIAMRTMRRSFREPHGMNIARQLLDAACHMQSKRVIHRDLKLDNVMISGSGHIKMVDFGLACFEDDENEKKRQCGSPGFVAPEVIMGPHVSQHIDKNARNAGNSDAVSVTTKADLFSIGCISYAILIGKLPYQGETIKEILVRNCKAKFKKCKKFEQLMPLTQQLITQLMERNPKDRVSALEALDIAKVVVEESSANHRTESRPLARVTTEQVVTRGEPAIEIRMAMTSTGRTKLQYRECKDKVGQEKAFLHAPKNQESQCFASASTAVPNPCEKSSQKSSQEVLSTKPSAQKNHLEQQIAGQTVQVSKEDKKHCQEVESPFFGKASSLEKGPSLERSSSFEKVPSVEQRQELRPSLEKVPSVDLRQAPRQEQQAPQSEHAEGRNSFERDGRNSFYEPSEDASSPRSPRPGRNNFSRTPSEAPSVQSEAKAPALSRSNSNASLSSKISRLSRVTSRSIISARSQLSRQLSWMTFVSSRTGSTASRNFMSSPRSVAASSSPSSPTLSYRTQMSERSVDFHGNFSPGTSRVGTLKEAGMEANMQVIFGPNGFAQPDSGRSSPRSVNLKHQLPEREEGSENPSWEFSGKGFVLSPPSSKNSKRTSPALTPNPASTTTPQEVSADSSAEGLPVPSIEVLEEMTVPHAPRQSSSAKDHSSLVPVSVQPSVPGVVGKEQTITETSEDEASEMSFTDPARAGPQAADVDVAPSAPSKLEPVPANPMVDDDIKSLVPELGSNHSFTVRPLPLSQDFEDEVPKEVLKPRKNRRRASAPSRILQSMRSSVRRLLSKNTWHEVTPFHGSIQRRSTSK